MKLITSYAIRITANPRMVNATIRVFRSAVKFLYDVCLNHYDRIEGLPLNIAQSNIEKLVHSTKNNNAIYPGFDKLFYKLPGYYRRSAIDTAIANVKSYMELLNLYKVGKGDEPRLNRNQAVMPCLFRAGLYKELDKGYCSIKLYNGSDWVWYALKMKPSDIRYIQANCNNLKTSAPVLEKRMNHISLRFTYKDNVTMRTKANELTKRIVAVDLGINTDATCSVIESDGTVIARRFINHAIEKDRMYHILNRIKKSQQHGNFKNPRLWRFVNDYNKAIAIKASSEIIAFAREFNATAIVMENLTMNGRKRGNKKQRLHMWRKREIFARVMALGHKYGIRSSSVCAWNTSRLAFDGSGSVIRDKGNYSICKFTTGKVYNCDLSASYNIGARYFIRDILKSLPETARCALLAKVPGADKRTTSTLSTLISLNVELKALKAA